MSGSPPSLPTCPTIPPPRTAPEDDHRPQLDDPRERPMRTRSAAPPPCSPCPRAGPGGRSAGRTRTRTRRVDAEAGGSRERYEHRPGRGGPACRDRRTARRGCDRGPRTGQQHRRRLAGQRGCARSGERPGGGPGRPLPGRFDDEGRDGGRGAPARDGGEGRPEHAGPALPPRTVEGGLRAGHRTAVADHTSGIQTGYGFGDYAKKRGSAWVGCKIHLSESCDDPDESGRPHLITHVVASRPSIFGTPVASQLS
jgi:hypothetical protein